MLKTIKESDMLLKKVSIDLRLGMYQVSLELRREMYQVWEGRLNQKNYNLQSGECSNYIEKPSNSHRFDHTKAICKIPDNKNVFS